MCLLGWWLGGWLRGFGLVDFGVRGDLFWVLTLFGMVLQMSFGGCVLVVALCIA